MRKDLGNQSLLKSFRKQSADRKPHAMYMCSQTGSRTIRAKYHSYSPAQGSRKELWLHSKAPEP